MEKKYTKKQILNTIAYWTRHLHLMDESKSNAVDMLEDHFGHDAVYSNFMDYDITQQDCEAMFAILNKTLFNSSLKPIPVMLWPEAQIVKQINQNTVASGRPDRQLSKSNCYGAYTGVCKDIKDADSNVVDIAISNEMILINRTALTTCTFIFAVACICHEMIHYYDRFTQEFHDKQLNASQNDEEFDSHKDKAFQEKMLEANQNGIDVEENFLRLGTYRNMNSKARYVLRREIGEDENDSLHVFGNEHSLFMKNHKTGTMFFAFFD